MDKWTTTHRGDRAADGHGPADLSWTVPDTMDRARALRRRALYRRLAGFGPGAAGGAEAAAMAIGVGPESATAWWVHLLAVGAGLVYGPGRLLMAYARGAAGRWALARPMVTLEAATPDALRAMAGLDRPPPFPRPAQLFFFLRVIAAALTALAATLAAAPLLRLAGWWCRRRLTRAGMWV